jgi:hypothetical protein
MIDKPLHDGAVLPLDPGGEPDVEVVARSLPFVDWHRGARSWSDAVRAGDIEVHGARSLTRALPMWNRRAPAVA